MHLTNPNCSQNKEHNIEGEDHSEWYIKEQELREAILCELYKIDWLIHMMAQRKSHGPNGLCNTNFVRNTIPHRVWVEDVVVLIQIDRSQITKWLKRTVYQIHTNNNSKIVFVR